LGKITHWLSEKKAAKGDWSRLQNKMDRNI